MEEEIWKDIKGYEGKYQVSNQGRVRSILNYKKRDLDMDKILKQFQKQSSTSRYKRIKLRLNGVSKSFLLHRLIATAFIPNPENKPCVNHIDGNGFNNTLSNLEWCTQKENMKHSRYILGNRYLSNKVIQYKDDVELEVFSSLKIAADALKTTRNNILEVCLGKQKTWSGYMFALVEKSYSCKLSLI